MKKEAYVDSVSLRRRSRDFLARLAGFCRHADLPRFSAPALLVVDMQGIFLDPDSPSFVPSAPAIMDNVLALQHAFLQRSLPVIHTRHGNTAADAGMMAPWWGGLIDPRDPRAAVSQHLADDRVTVIAKTQYDAFFATGLSDLLRARGVGQLVVCGVKTHLCCDTTARSAFMRGYAVIVPVDATASDHRDLHLGSLKALSHGVAVPALTRQIVSALEGGPSR